MLLPAFAEPPFTV